MIFHSLDFLFCMKWTARDFFTKVCLITKYVSFKSVFYSNVNFFSFLFRCSLFNIIYAYLYCGGLWVFVGFLKAFEKLMWNWNQLTL